MEEAQCAKVHSHAVCSQLSRSRRPSWANEDVIKLSSDPNNWAIQSGDYAGTRYSTLDQITTANVGQLKVAWTFSTGVLRGHEGGPLVIGDTM